MQQNLPKYVHDSFKKLEVHGWSIKEEINVNQEYMIIFKFDTVIISIQNYFRELYVSLWNQDEPDNKVDVFNLLEYLKQENGPNPKANYFSKEKNLDECYKQQLKYLSDIIYENHNHIHAFFSIDSYKVNFTKFNEFWENAHPELY